MALADLEDKTGVILNKKMQDQSNCNLRKSTNPWNLSDIFFSEVSKSRFQWRLQVGNATVGPEPKALRCYVSIENESNELFVATL